MACAPPHVVLEEVVAMLGGTRPVPPPAAALLLHNLLAAANGPSSCKLVKGWAVFTKHKTYALHVWVEAGGAALDPTNEILARKLGQKDLGAALGLVLTAHEPDPASFKQRDDDRQREDTLKHLEAYQRKPTLFWQRMPPTLQLKRRLLKRKFAPNALSA